jgi:hypothetical protein
MVGQVRLGGLGNVNFECMLFERTTSEFQKNIIRSINLVPKKKVKKKIERRKVRKKEKRQRERRKEGKKERKKKEIQTKI